MTFTSKTNLTSGHIYTSHILMLVGNVDGKMRPLTLWKVKADLRVVYTLKWQTERQMDPPCFQNKIQI